MEKCLSCKSLTNYYIKCKSCSQNNCMRCCVLYGCCKSSICNNCIPTRDRISPCPLCKNQKPDSVIYKCDFCNVNHSIDVYSLNFPSTDICDSCSIVVVRCEKCNKWATDEICENCL